MGSLRDVTEVIFCVPPKSFDYVLFFETSGDPDDKNGTSMLKNACGVFACIDRAQTEHKLNPDND